MRVGGAALDGWVMRFGGSLGGYGWVRGHHNSAGGGVLVGGFMRWTLGGGDSVAPEKMLNSVSTEKELL